MELLEGALWGAFGGFAMESLDFIVAVRRWRRWPWQVGSSSLGPGTAAAGATAPHGPSTEAPPLPATGFLAYSIAVALRLVVGAGTAAAVASASPAAASAWLMVLTGATAPHVLEKVTMFVPLVVKVGREGINAVQQQGTVPSPSGYVPPQTGGPPQSGAAPGQPPPGLPAPTTDPAPGGAAPQPGGM
ncbi:hypothetical protein [Streptomyces vinaceus]|uniref:hypothetical protein n=1 Tax=Streptomyces vinaceus TaxID=1960 RepID=UPI0035DDA433